MIRDLLDVLRSTDWTLFAVEFVVFGAFFVAVIGGLSLSANLFPELFP